MSPQVVTGSRYRLDVGFVEEDGTDGVAEGFHVLFGQMLAVHQLCDPFVGVHLQMLHLRLLVASLSLAAASWAIHESDVGVVDWHSRLVGVPLKTNFHDDLILTAIASNAFAALNATDGSFGGHGAVYSWRSIHDDNDPIIAFDVYDDSSTCLCRLAFYHATFFSSVASTALPALKHTKYDAQRSQRNELRPRGVCAHQWPHDNRSLVVYSYIRNTSDTVYTVDNGSTIASLNIPANIPTEMPGFVFLGMPMTAEIAQAPCLTELESTSIRAAVLTQGLKGQVQILPRVNYTHIQDVGLTGAGQFITFA
ncbi:hypothetical protein BKA82DRAFT_28091 [Pisolithus tinctorius]|uniref:Uncharacterized protein n=1 Tax=Pisolithus tinctorius Marx 270 TaxID=870435 RepID=A0A0C3IZC6_PISTI|nr:hypothetical protein BKA82DRAFT_28091 [Pisolithus tinctorius]KIO02158.1 hypothetical protein M404DRAFT_28091 [Pisolithus tinctorius Marx 270]